MDPDAEIPTRPRQGASVHRKPIDPDGILVRGYHVKEYKVEAGGNDEAPSILLRQEKEFSMQLEEHEGDDSLEEEFFDPGEPEIQLFEEEDAQVKFGAAETVGTLVIKIDPEEEILPQPSQGEPIRQAPMDPDVIEGWNFEGDDKVVGNDLSKEENSRLADPVANDGWTVEEFEDEDVGKNRVLSMLFHQEKENPVKAGHEGGKNRKIHKRVVQMYQRTLQSVHHRTVPHDSHQDQEEPELHKHKEDELVALGEPNDQPVEPSNLLHLEKDNKDDKNRKIHKRVVHLYQKSLQAVHHRSVSQKSHQDQGVPDGNKLKEDGLVAQEEPNDPLVEPSNLLPLEKDNKDDKNRKIHKRVVQLYQRSLQAVHHRTFAQKSHRDQGEPEVDKLKEDGLVAQEELNDPLVEPSNLLHQENDNKDDKNQKIPKRVVHLYQRSLQAVHLRTVPQKSHRDQGEPELHKYKEEEVTSQGEPKKPLYREEEDPPVFPVAKGELNSTEYEDEIIGNDEAPSIMLFHEEKNYSKIKLQKKPNVPVSKGAFNVDHYVDEVIGHDDAPSILIHEENEYQYQGVQFHRMPVVPMSKRGWRTTEFEDEVIGDDEAPSILLHAEKEYRYP